MNFKLIEKEFASYITKNEMSKIKEKNKTNEYKLAIKLNKKYRVSDNAVYVLYSQTRKQKNLFLLSSTSNPRTPQQETDLIARRSISNSTRIIKISYV